MNKYVFNATLINNNNQDYFAFQNSSLIGIECRVEIYRNQTYS